MIDRKHIGSKSEPLVVEVEKGQLRFFAKATAENNPIYTDEDAAIAAGYKSLPAPPTFGFSLGLAKPEPFKRYIELGIDLNKMLHGGQKFEYLTPIFAGDIITLEETLTDIYDKKGGALEFCVFETTCTNQHNERVANLTSTIVVRNG